MGDFLGVTDAFVITSGANSRQVRTIVEEVERQVKDELGRSPRATEGLRDLTWVLMDYGDFLVHVFQDEARRYYDLEQLWGDAPASRHARRRPSTTPTAERRRRSDHGAPSRRPSRSQRGELRRGGHRDLRPAGHGHLHGLAVELEGHPGHAGQAPRR